QLRHCPFAQSCPHRCTDQHAFFAGLGEPLHVIGAPQLLPPVATLSSGRRAVVSWLVIDATSASTAGRAAPHRLGAPPATLRSITGAAAVSEWLQTIVLLRTSSNSAESMHTACTSRPSSTSSNRSILPVSRYATAAPGSRSATSLNSAVARTPPATDSVII